MGQVLSSTRGPKRGGLLCSFRGELGPHLAQCGLGRDLSTKWHLNASSRLATTDIGRKLGKAVPF